MVYCEHDIAILQKMTRYDYHQIYYHGITIILYYCPQWRSQARAHWGTCPSNFRLCPSNGSRSLVPRLPPEYERTIGREASQREIAWLGPLCEVGVYIAMDNIMYVVPNVPRECFLGTVNMQHNNFQALRVCNNHTHTHSRYACFIVCPTNLKFLATPLIAHPYAGARSTILLDNATEIFFKAVSY